MAVVWLAVSMLTIPKSAGAIGATTHWVAQDGVAVGTGSSCSAPGYVGTDQTPIINAIEAADAGDTVYICAGDYHFTANGVIGAVASDITVSGSGEHATVLDGLSTYQVLAFNSGAENLLIKNLGIHNGSWTYGGGLYIYWSSFEVRNVRFEGNYGGNYGGGALYVEDSIGTSRVVDSVFDSNVAEWGGAIVVDNSDLEVIESDFTNNSTYYESASMAPDYGGAGIYLYGGSLTVEDSRFIANSTPGTSGGAAIHVYEGSLSVDGSEFSGNRAAQGPAIYSYGTSLGYDSSATLTITNSQFIGNQNLTFDDGGAIASERNGRDITLNGNLFSKNRGAFWGGAVEIWLVGGDLSITDNEFKANSAREGGALWIDVRGGVAEIHGNRFLSNRARYGSAVSFECQTISANSISRALLRGNRFAPAGASSVFESKYAVSGTCD